MLEKIKTELGFINMPVKVELKNGKTKHGVLIDFMEDNNYQPDYWKFVSNYDILKYEQTESPQFVEVIATSNIAYIDTCLK